VSSSGLFSFNDRRHQTIERRHGRRHGWHHVLSIPRGGATLHDSHIMMSMPSVHVLRGFNPVDSQHCPSVPSFCPSLSAVGPSRYSPSLVWALYNAFFLPFFFFLAHSLFFFFFSSLLSWTITCFTASRLKTQRENQKSLLKLQWDQVGSRTYIDCMKGVSNTNAPGAKVH
jgi:hypothetical protein